MTEVNNINNIAREIVSNLDKKDGNADGKIEASIWNKFVCKKEGNEINNFIKTDNAIKSVIAYLKRETAKTGQAIEDVANEWLKKVGGGDKTEIDESRFDKSENDIAMKPVIIEEYEKGLDGQEIDDKYKQKIQQAADDATQLLMDIANKDYRYSIDSDSYAKGYEGRIIELKDGRAIHLALKKQENGKYKISTLYVFGNKNNSYNFAYGSENNRIRTRCFNVDQQGDCFAGTTRNKDTIESLLKLVQKIFGDDIEV